MWDICIFCIIHTLSHIGYEPKYGWCRTYAHKQIDILEKKSSVPYLSESLNQAIKMWPDIDGG